MAVPPAWICGVETVATPPVLPKEQLPTATGMAKKEVMERKTTHYINGKSSRGEWLFQNRTIGVVEDFDHTRGIFRKTGPGTRSL